jgi:hypothetical protein
VRTRSFADGEFTNKNRDFTDKNRDFTDKNRDFANNLAKVMYFQALSGESLRFNARFGSPGGSKLQTQVAPGQFRGS